jgi:hypothetical protein
MYSSLTSYGQSRSANNTHYPCPSMPLPAYNIDVDLSMDHQKRPKVTFADDANVIHSKPPRTKLSSESSSSDLLPVMDPRFNLREICKQCVLLEDHLTHKEKRCSDCCTKHFLTLEALAEEALTLDKEGVLSKDAEDLPRRIRQLELMWIKDPSKCTEISQKLREIRKQFQQVTFPIITNGCSDNSCKVSL